MVCSDIQGVWIERDSPWITLVFVIFTWVWRASRTWRRCLFEISSYVLEVQVISPYLLRVSKFYDLKTSDCHCTLLGCTETKMSLYNFHPAWRGSETWKSRETRTYSRKGFWKLPMNLLLFSVKSVISRIWNLSGTVRPLRDIQVELNSKFVIFLSISSCIDRQSNRQYSMKMWPD